MAYLVSSVEDRFRLALGSLQFELIVQQHENAQLKQQIEELSKPQEEPQESTKPGPKPVKP